MSNIQLMRFVENKFLKTVVVSLDRPYLYLNNYY